MGWWLACALAGSPIQGQAPPCCRTNHVTERHIEEEASGHRQNPGLTLLAYSDRKRHVETDEGCESRGQVQQQSSPNSQTSVQQSSEVSWGHGHVRSHLRAAQASGSQSLKFRVIMPCQEPAQLPGPARIPEALSSGAGPTLALTQLMWQLVAKHCQRGGQPCLPGGREGRAHGQPICKVVHSVAQRD